MPSIQAAIKAAALHRARVAAGQKALVRSGPLLQRSMVGRPLQQRDWYTEQAVERYFKLSGLVYRAAVSLATAVGSVRWQVETRTSGQWERMDEDHELQHLLDQPHPYFNRQAWNEMLVIYLVLVGNGLNQKTVASGKPSAGAKFGRVLEMVPLVPDAINPVPDDVEWISRWDFKGPPHKTWEPHEMFHVMLPNPGNLYWGMSPFHAVRKIIQTDLAAIDWNQSSMANRAISDGVFSVAAALTTEQHAELKDQVWMYHQGSENAHEPWVLGGDAKWLAMERTPVEMDFNTTRMRLREDVLSSAGIPPVVAGYFENATLANADVSRRLFWEDSAIPNYVERIAGAINGGIVPHFGDAAKLRVTYDISGIPALRDDLVKKAAALKTLLSCGVRYNDAIEELELDLPRIEGLGDVPYGLETMRPALGAGAAPAEGEAGGATVAVGAPTEPATEQDVAVSEAAVLNGAQITAATAIVTAVAAGEMPRDSGLGQLRVLFNLTDEQAEAIMGSAGTDEPTTPNPRPRAEGSPDPANPPAEGVIPPQLADTMIPAKRRTAHARKLGAGVRTGVFAADVADQEAPAIRAAFMAVVAKLRQGTTLADLVAAVAASDAGAALAKLGGHQLSALLREGLALTLGRTLERGAALAAEALARDLGIESALATGPLKAWLEPYLHERVAQLTATTEGAAREFFADLAAGKLGADPGAQAQLLRETWGLHRQQAAGVRNLYAALLDRQSPQQAADTAAKLARGRLAERAQTIADHESLTAANRGNGLAWETAAADGVVSIVTATWYASDTCEDEECLGLDGQEANITAGELFTGPSGRVYREPPGPHPSCMCGLLYSAIA